MTPSNDLDTAMDAARAAGTGPLDGFLEGLADRIGAKATVQTVFGEPIERDGVTVIPVAKVRWAFGGGAGNGPADADGAPVGAGQGGGGGVTADPIGWIEIGPDGAAFQPIVPAMPSPGFLLAAGATAALVLRAIARLLRG
jgi:uncharacterized spore protein YtfJ